MTRILTSVVICLGLGIPTQAADDPKLAAQARQVLKTFCYRCHSGKGSSSGYAFDVTAHATLIQPLEKSKAMVVPKDLNKSPLWDAIQERMPQVGSSEGDQFGCSERKVIEQWILAGAPAFPPAEERAFRSLNEELTAVRTFLSKIRLADREHFRFFTLANKHNDPRVFNEDLRYIRAALSKVLNSVSWEKDIVVPVAVDKSETLYAIDLRKLDWQKEDMWRKVVDAYPYGLKYGSHKDEDLRELDREICQDTKSQVPVIRADWFISTASRPPLYHDLLQFPKNAKDLEKKLEVDIPKNFENDQLGRAGFSKSGVSGQNRLLERHRTKYGAYWKSYDFLPDSGRANLVRFPLGPTFANHPYPNQVFKHDGGEIIFNLPNGLQAYLLVNGKDERIDAGPIDVVADDKRVSGTPAIVNGVSCMSCHSQGMIPFTDFIRDNNAVFGEANSKVKKLYPEKKVLDDWVEQDRKLFLDSLEKAIGPFLKVGPDKATPITQFKEPVAEISIPYRRGYLDIQAAAAELYLSNPEELRRVGDKRLKSLGLEPLGKPGGVVGRYLWESGEGISLMQETARELGFTPLR